MRKALLDLRWIENACRVIAHTVGQEHAQRRQRAGESRHNHGPDTQFFRHFAGVQPATAAESNQREVARIAPALDRNHADRSLHIGIGNAHDPLGHSDPVPFEHAGNATHCRVSPRRIDMHRATQKLI